MQHLKFVIICCLVLSSIGVVAQESARTVQYHSQDIVPIRAKVKYTTLIELPTTEKIMPLKSANTLARLTIDPQAIRLRR